MLWAWCAQIYHPNGWFAGGEERGRQDGAQAPTKSRGRIPNEALNESVRILNHDTGCRRTSTSTSRKSLSRDTDNPIELYA